MAVRVPRKGAGHRLTPDMVERAGELAKKGLTSKEIAKALEISVGTLGLYSKLHAPMGDAIRAGKRLSDQNVVGALYSRACGYSHPDVDVRVIDGAVVKVDIVKHYPPDPTSMIFGLKNRQPDKWQDRMQFAGAGGKPLFPENPDPLEVARRVAFVFAQALAQQKKIPETITQEKEAA